MKTLRYSIFSLALAGLFFTSCTKDQDDRIDNDPDPIPTAAYQKGIFVSNEGPFGSGSGTVTFISEDYSRVEKDIYKKVNGIDLGNVVNSIGFENGKAYIVANNSNRMMVADRYSFEAAGTVASGLDNPRHFVATDSNIGYVTNWGDPMNESDDYVAVVDLQSNTVTSTISVPFGPEKMLVNNNRIYVAHQGGYGHHHIISVISGGVVENTITVGDAPNSMVKIGNFLYVLGGGKPDYTGDETAGTLSKIDLTTETVVERIDFETTDHPEHLTADGDMLFFNLNGKVYKLSAGAITANPTPVLDGYFYAMTAKDGKLFATDAGDFASNGKMYVYDLSNGEKLYDFEVGVIPGGIYFNE